MTAAGLQSQFGWFGSFCLIFALIIFACQIYHGKLEVQLDTNDDLFDDFPKICENFPKILEAQLDLQLDLQPDLQLEVQLELELELESKLNSTDYFSLLYKRQ